MAELTVVTTIEITDILKDSQLDITSSSEKLAKFKELIAKSYKQIIDESAKSDDVNIVKVQVFENVENKN